MRVALSNRYIYWFDWVETELLYCARYTKSIQWLSIATRGVRGPSANLPSSDVLIGNSNATESTKECNARRRIPQKAYPGTTLATQAVERH